jgi:hypothetical protein
MGVPHPMGGYLALYVRTFGRSRHNNVYHQGFSPKIRFAHLDQDDHVCQDEEETHKWQAEVHVTQKTHRDSDTPVCLTVDRKVSLFRSRTGGQTNHVTANAV